MQDIQQILVPVDFHQHTDDLAAFASGIANKLGATITFVHVVGHFAEVAADAGFYPASVTEVEKEMEENAKKKMAALIEQHKAASPGCGGTVIIGEVADIIVRYAMDNKIDMIVMATHGAQGIEKIMLGSVADRVLKRAACPILLFNPYKGERGYQITTPIGDNVQPI
ncbi:UspA domain-containing protein [Desulfobulbus propionicus DSM 2032]|jgi:nucleotide-binding universal stress UspA family protein|uniref:UspA domain-containing protein n=1 Tax=Desulfobulbus propionicus (strain ATCC 33891 / DSM 2032 / VKM B-1956 / 1pr3) TaxID=577650 RepID=A0A7U3YL22_DESPD|nr:universal stress protein [Desulfobulbus propionicus]ADW17358.1 UspA domain-containing protein [Desulfobulbus propionicus DSM 2032]